MQIRPRVFFSFDYDDVLRAEIVRNCQVVRTKGMEGWEFYDAADREQVIRKNPNTVKSWIDDQLTGTSVTVVLIGTQTSNSHWVKYEIKKSIELGKGLLGIFIHNIPDMNNRPAIKGADPLPYPYMPKDWVNDGGYKNIGRWIEKAWSDARG